MASSGLPSANWPVMTITPPSRSGFHSVESGDAGTHQQSITNDDAVAYQDAVADHHAVGNDYAGGD